MEGRKKDADSQRSLLANAKSRVVRSHPSGRTLHTLAA
jgi:hypothetical protein